MVNTAVGVSDLFFDFVGSHDEYDPTNLASVDDAAVRYAEMLAIVGIEVAAADLAKDFRDRL